MSKVRRALLSVSDKSGIVELAKFLSSRNVEILSTGGTARTLKEAGLDVIDVASVTEFPEMMDGRVKTLHPRIHGGLLGLLDNESHVAEMRAHEIQSIDLVVVNLYPFEKTVANPESTDEEIIEQIDIGGPAMIRSAAKNWKFTAVVVDPVDYQRLQQELSDDDCSLSDRFRRELAHKAFSRTAEYDSAIRTYLADSLQSSDNSTKELSLRYGENPHQSARLTGDYFSIYRYMHGKELSYNNILDIDAAAQTVLEFDEPCVVIVKHTNPCGVGIGETLIDAWHKAFATDTKSPFGGIIAVNRELDIDIARAIDEIFSEVVIAPSYSAEAIELLEKKKNRRLMQVDFEQLRHAVSMRFSRSVAGGLLEQDGDALLWNDDGLKVATKRQPTDEEMQGMIFAWKVAKHVKSNAIVYARKDRTLGIGAGQMSRVDSATIAARKAEEAGLDLTGCAVASDAFFPFADGLLEAVEAGAACAIQPGGSIRDNEVIDAADEKGIAMVMTGMRHFRH